MILPWLVLSARKFGDISHNDIWNLRYHQTIQEKVTNDSSRTYNLSLRKKFILSLLGQLKLFCLRRQFQALLSEMFTVPLSWNFTYGKSNECLFLRYDRSFFCSVNIFQQVYYSHNSLIKLTFSFHPIKNGPFLQTLLSMQDGTFLQKTMISSDKVANKPQE